MTRTMTDALSRLPPDEHAILAFLSAMAGDDQVFVSRDLDLVAMLQDCSVERFRLLARRLERRGLIERTKLNRIGTEWYIPAKVDEAVGDLFVIPQNRPSWPSVTAARKAAFADVLPLVGQAPARKPPVLFFPRGKCGFDFVWHVVDDRGDAVVRDCSVKATLFRGRSAFGVGGVAVAGFDGVSMQSVGLGDYLARITISATAECDSNYVTVISARRHGKQYGWWEEPSEIISEP